MRDSVFSGASWWCRSSEERESPADQNGGPEVKSVERVGLGPTERREMMNGIVAKIGFWKVSGFS